MYYIKNAPENASLPTIFENMRFALPLPLPLPAPAPRSQQPCFGERECRECHFPKILGSGASRERLLYIYFYIYYVYIQQKHAKDKLAAKYMKTCIYVLVNEYYIIMKFEMPSLLHSILMIISKL